MRDVVARVPPVAKRYRLDRYAAVLGMPEAALPLFLAQ